MLQKRFLEALNSLPARILLHPLHSLNTAENNGGKCNMLHVRPSIAKENRCNTHATRTWHHDQNWSKSFNQETTIMIMASKNCHNWFSMLMQHLQDLLWEKDFRVLYRLYIHVFQLQPFSFLRKPKVHSVQMCEVSPYNSSAFHTTVFALVAGS